MGGILNVSDPYSLEYTLGESILKQGLQIGLGTGQDVPGLYPGTTRRDVPGLFD